MRTVRQLLEAKAPEVFAIGPDAPVLDAIKLMADKRIGALLVMDAGRLVGIVSERDYARKVILLGKSSKDTTVAAIMTASPVTVTPAHTVDDCMRLVSEHRIRHLPVVESGEPVGMISIGDLVKAIISSQAFTIDQLHTYIGADYPS